MATKPEFVHVDSNRIITEMKARYEAEAGKVLQPAQPEQLLINDFAYRELLLRIGINEAAAQNLLAFATGSQLEGLGEIVGVTRLAAITAVCDLVFTLVDGHGAVIIPEGTRVTSTDGRAVFATKAAANVAIGVNTVTVAAECLTPGVIGNGYLPGDIKVILDPQAFISAATNVQTTARGSEMEADENLRERIQLAPASFSNAGSEGAYIFWARSASPSIIDVKVKSWTPGTVTIYPLMDDGEPTPDAIIDAVLAACTPKKVRPLCDTVDAIGPTRIEYAIEANLTLLEEADQETVLAAINANLQTFIDKKRKSLGNDVLQNQVRAQIMVEGLYDVALVGWSDIIADETTFAFCTGIELVVIGTNNG